MSGVSLSRRASLAFAIALAALAAVALYAYVRGLERQALGRGDTVRVLVAKETIPAGTAAADAMHRGLMGRTSIPRQAVVDGAIASLEDIDGRVAGVDILRGEQIVGKRFVTPERARSAFAIPAERQAMAVEVSGPQGVGGYVQRGDRVSIIARSAGSDARVAYLVQGVEVLAVGQRAPKAAAGGRETSAPQTGKVVLTLALTPQEAEKVAYALMEGELWLTLLPPGQQPQGTPGRAAETLFT